MSKITINNIIMGDKAIDKQEVLMKELLLEMGMVLDFDLDKILSRKVDNTCKCGGNCGH